MSEQVCVRVCVCVRDDDDDDTWENNYNRTNVVWWWMNQSNNVRSVVTSESDEHNSDLSNLAFCLELHFRFGRLDDIALNDCALVTAFVCIRMCVVSACRSTLLVVQVELVVGQIAGRLNTQYTIHSHVIRNDWIWGVATFVRLDHKVAIETCAAAAAHYYGLHSVVTRTCKHTQQHNNTTTGNRV